MEDNNYYEDKQNRQFLDKTTEKSKTSGKQVPEKKQKEETTKEKMNRTAKEVGTDVVAGVLGGGLGAAIFGSYSFFAGLLVSGYGHYTKNKYVARLGLGMMSSSSMKMAQGVKQDPNASMIDNIQERVKAFGQELKRKLLLDKLLPGKKQTEAKAEDKLSGVTLQSEVVDVPSAEAFEEKDRLEQKTSELKHNLPDPLNKVVERPIAKPLYKEDKDDLSDVTDHLY